MLFFVFGKPDQEAAKTAQDAPRGPQEAPRCPQEAFKSQKRRQYDTFLKSRLFARDVLVDLHLNLALFAFPPCKNIDFLILFVKTSHPRRLPNRSIQRKTLPEFEFWLIECIHKLLASSSPLKKAAGTRVLGTLTSWRHSKRPTAFLLGLPREL